MNEIERLEKVVLDQTRMIQEKNRLLSEMEYRLKQNIVTGSRKEDLAKYQFQLSRDTIEGQGSLLKTILGSIPFGLMVMDTKNQVISYNGAAEAILELSDKEVLGKPCFHLFGLSEEAQKEMEGASDNDDACQGHRIEIRKKNGNEKILSISIAPINNKNGVPMGRVVLFSDVTGEVAKEGLLQEKHYSLVRVMTRLMEKKDDYTLAHSERVKDLAMELAAELGLSGPEEQREISSASLLHDIGLLSVPDEVLISRKTGIKAPDEIIRAHPIDGEWMVASMEGFGQIKKMIRSHHERYDGGGYPDGLSGDEIPFVSRIIGVAEAYDAMIHDESSRRKSKEDALGEISENRGGQFDPEVVDVFLNKVARHGK